ncbi:MAG: chorismate mutase [Lentisphaeria bacterium]|nr:chorismate mutase [Lentisphaeria bacterium]
MSNDLKAARQEIDKIDNELLQLFLKRMELGERIGKYKQENGLPIENPEREREILLHIWDSADPEMRSYACILYSTLIDLNKAYQRRLNPQGSRFIENIGNTLKNTEPVFPKTAKVACCGIPGAYAQIVTDKLFQLADLMYFNDFSAVFQAVENGLCRYGVLPIENSTAGTVDAVYDLMKDHHFCIVRSFRLPIRHSLLVNEGTKLEDVREVISHEQALKQCSRFLGNLNVKRTSCSSTAMAARIVSESGRKDVAAIASPNCAELYKLEILNDTIQNSDFNYTRFICISKKPEIYPGANRISIMATLPHKPGQLNRILSRFSVLSVNLTKLESRPIPGHNFEYMFYFDFEATVADPDVCKLLAELEQSGGKFFFLGNYAEY